MEPVSPRLVAKLCCDGLRQMARQALPTIHAGFSDESRQKTRNFNRRRMVAGLRNRLLGGLTLALVSTAPLMAQNGMADPAPMGETAENEIPENEIPENEIPENEIIVPGYTKKQVRNFMWRSMIETGQVVAKRSGPICVGIDNAPAALAVPLKARIEANLTDVGVSYESAGCRANSVIAFHPDAHQFVKWLEKQNAGSAFWALYLPEQRRLTNPVRPVYNWHFVRSGVAQTIWGRPLPLVQQASSRGFQATGFGPGGRLAEAQQPGISSHSFSVIDIDAIDGITIEQLGDYLTMQMLVEFRPGVRPEVPRDSILNLFDAERADPDAPLTMSDLDRTVLTQLYGKRQNFRAAAVRNAVARQAIADLRERDRLIEFQ